MRLTHNQAKSVMMRVSELHATAMREHRTTRGRTQHDYDLPAIAWRQILDVMLAACYGPMGGKLKGQGRPSDSAYIAIRKIGSAVKNMEGHPALRGAVVEGSVGDIIPVFVREVAVWPPLSAYPGNGDRGFSLMMPEVGTNLGMQVTRWIHGPMWLEDSLRHEGAGSWTFQSESHLMFVQPSPSA